ncbi:MAG: hypothetical protein NC131_08565 [Roseburia sp.]|nr:hypothetical protein [Roseburia sp.]
MAILNAGGFTLELKFFHHRETIEFKNYITDTTVRISVSDLDYSGITEFAISCEECVNFIKSLTELFGNLNTGVTGISDYEPDENNLYFQSDGLGHFNVSGVFNNWGDWTLKFEKELDQSYFKNFIKQLNCELAEFEN